MLVLSGRPLRASEPVAPMVVLNLTAEERAWVAEHPGVLVAFTESYPPYSQRLPDGRMVGIDLDYLNLIANRTGLTFKPIIVHEWSEAEEALKAGRVDLLTGLVHTAKREAYLIFTASYIQVPEVIVTRTDMPYVLDVAQTSGLRLGKVRGTSSALENLPPVVAVSQRMQEFENINAVFEALSRGTIDATITDTVNAAYTIKLQHLTNLRLGSVIGGAGDTFLGVTRQKPMLAQIINKAIATITLQERQAIDERWIALDLAPSKWLLAFKILAGVALVAIVIFFGILFHNRRLAAELNERHRIQRQLEKAHAKLAAVNGEKSELLRMVAHDLRSPLTGFQLATGLLQEECNQLSPLNQDLLLKMKHSVGQMLRMVEDLVDVQMLEEGRHSYQWNEVDFSFMLREVVDVFAERAAQKSIQMALRTQEPVMKLRTDARALRQVVDNLVSNALKYSPAHTEVCLDLQWDDEACRLLVHDQGPGVKPEEREKVFEKYGLGSARATDGEKSTGLGLWIARRITTDLHGKIWCESGPETVGSIFIVEVPRRPPSS